MAFTFKTEKPTGSYKSFYNDTHIIKIKKCAIGEISDKTWKIRLQVIKDDINFKDDNQNCKWKWIILKKEFESLQDAKDFLNRNYDRIIEKYPLYKIEN